MTDAAPGQTRETQKKVFIVEDHPVFRKGLEQLVNNEGDLTVCGSAETVAEALKGIARLRPRLVLIDISLPDRTGLELIRAIRVKDQEIKLLVISMHDEALYANRVLRAGGDGYIMKQEDPAEIVHAIRDVLQGHLYVSEKLFSERSATKPGGPSLQPQSRPLAELTDLELEILEQLGFGKTNEETARHLKLVPEKVETACAEMQRKLKLKTYNALIRQAVCWVGAAAE